jgi:glycosyltransferase involved in cell wall biosynthesis
MWHGRSLCDGIVERRRCAECELEHRGAHPALAALVAQMPEAISRVGRLVPGRVGTAIGMSALIDHNRQRQHDLMRAVDRFVVLTRRAAAIVVANGAPPEKIAVNPLGISQIVSWPPPAPPSRRGPHVRIGWVGRFDPVKGVCDLVEAIRRLPHDTPLHFELRGLAQTATDRRTLEALRTALAGDARVRFADPVSTASIPDVMRSYDVLCCPSRCLEGGPTVGLEAIAVGTPVIAADAGGLAEVLVDGVNGRLVPPGDVDALTAALQEVARSPEGTLDRWRTALPRPRTMHEVAADYLSLYARVN